MSPPTQHNELAGGCNEGSPKRLPLRCAWVATIKVAFQHGQIKIKEKRKNEWPLYLMECGNFTLQKSNRGRTITTKTF